MGKTKSAANFSAISAYNRITISRAVLWKNCRLQTPPAYVFTSSTPSFCSTTNISVVFIVIEKQQQSSSLQKRKKILGVVVSMWHLIYFK